MRRSIFVSNPRTAIYYGIGKDSGARRKGGKHAIYEEVGDGLAVLSVGLRVSSDHRLTVAERTPTA
jgi:hypothetical protein